LLNIRAYRPAAMRISVNSMSPPSLALSPRDLSLARAPIAARWYVGGDQIASAFLSALSATFPLGEKFFIDSVRRFRAGLDPDLGAVVDAFVVQEALHTREHLAFNRLVAATGYETTRMTERTRAVLAPFRARSPLRQLGLTMALEHLTAIFAHDVLTREERVGAAPAEVRALWRWHALEEIEHKAVAFDVFLHATRGWTPRRRYAFRVRAMIGATRVLLGVVARNMDDLFAQDDPQRRPPWRRAARYFLGRHGVVTCIIPGYARWFRPGFHPDQIDDRELASRAALELPAQSTRATRARA
jgi:hypothetical protein